MGKDSFPSSLSSKVPLVPSLHLQLLERLAQSRLPPPQGLTQQQKVGWLLAFCPLWKLHWKLACCSRAGVGTFTLPLGASALHLTQIPHGTWFAVTASDTAAATHVSTSLEIHRSLRSGTLLSCLYNLSPLSDQTSLTL